MVSEFYGDGFMVSNVHRDELKRNNLNGDYRSNSSEEQTQYKKI